MFSVRDDGTEREGTPKMGAFLETMGWEERESEANRSGSVTLPGGKGVPARESLAGLGVDERERPRSSVLVFISRIVGGRCSRKMENDAIDTWNNRLSVVDTE